MSNKYKFHNPDKLYFVTYSVIHWIDLFIRNEYKDILLNSWKYCMNYKGMELYGWCIMTSHIHMIMGSHGEKLENIMRDMKRHTSEKLKAAIQKHPAESRKEWILEMMRKSGTKNCHNLESQLWQQDNHPIELRDAKMMHQKLDYLHNNPVVAGFVRKAEDYLYSSAIDYYTDQKGLIDITYLEPLML